MDTRAAVLTHHMRFGLMHLCEDIAREIEAVESAAWIASILAQARKLGPCPEVAAVERAHAELVAALHATIRGAEPAGGAQ